MGVSGRTEEPSALSRWTRLLIGAAAMLLVAFVLIPATQTLGPVREVRDAIDRAGIDASALFYTETEQSFEAEASIRDSLRYSPNDGVLEQRLEGMLAA